MANGLKPGDPGETLASRQLTVGGKKEQHPEPAPPGLMERILNYFNIPSGVLPTPAELAAPAAMVINEGNAAKILDYLRKTESPNITPEQLKTSLMSRFMIMKNPSLVGKTISKINVLPSSPVGTLGSYANKAKSVQLMGPQQRNMLDVAETIGHEMTHGLQYMRNPDMFNNYVMPDVDFDAYMSHPTEVDARQGGATIKKAVQKFMDFVAPRFDVNQHVSEMLEFVNEVLRPTLAARDAYLDKVEETLPKEGQLSYNDKIRLKNLQLDRAANQYNKDMIDWHMNPANKSGSSTRLPLTGGMAINGIMPALGRSEGPNVFLRNFLTSRGYGGITAPQIPMGEGNVFTAPAISLDPYDILRKLVAQPSGTPIGGQ